MKEQMYYDIYLLNMTSNINKGCKKYSWAGNEGRTWAIIVYKMLFIYSMLWRAHFILFYEGWGLYTRFGLKTPLNHIFLWSRGRRGGPLPPCIRLRFSSQAHVIKHNVILYPFSYSGIYYLLVLSLVACQQNYRLFIPDVNVCKHISSFDK